MKTFFNQPLLSSKQVRQLFNNISPKTEIQWRGRILPEPVNLPGSRLIFYRTSEIEAIWNEQQGKKGGNDAK
jgi:hypothetical protein